MPVSTSLYKNRWQRPPFGTRINVAHPLSAQLQAAWLFTEVGNDVLFDSTGRYPATASGGTSLVWNGPGPYFNPRAGVGALSSLMPITTNMTISILGASEDFSVKQIGWGIESTPNCQIRVGDTGSNHINFIWGDSGENNLTSSAALSVNVVYAIVCSFDGTTQRIYINGIQDNTYNPPPTVTINRTVQVGVGARYGGSGSVTDSWKGPLQHIYLWARCLSAAEIMGLYYEPYAMF